MRQGGRLRELSAITGMPATQLIGALTHTTQEELAAVSAVTCMQGVTPCPAVSWSTAKTSSSTSLWARRPMTLTPTARHTADSRSVGTDTMENKTRWPTPIIGLDTVALNDWYGIEQQSGICFDGRLHAVAGPCRSAESISRRRRSRPNEV